MFDLTPYAPAMISVCLFALATLALGIMVGVGNATSGVVPGATPPPDYSSRLYRTARASANAIETMATYAPVVIVAILAGTDPAWTNRLAVAVLLFRVAVIVVHVQGIGRPNRSARTILFAGGLLSTVALALMTIFGLLSA